MLVYEIFLVVYLAVCLKQRLAFHGRDSFMLHTLECHWHALRILLTEIWQIM